MSEVFREVATEVRNLSSLKLLYCGETDGGEFYERTDYDQQFLLTNDIRTFEQHEIIENNASDLPTIDISRGSYSLTETGKEMAEQYFDKRELLEDMLPDTTAVESEIEKGINSEGYNISKSRQYKRGFVEQQGTIYEVRVDDLDEGKVEVSNKPVRNIPKTASLERTTKVLKGELPETDQELRELSTEALE